jgi:hypothetical protein
MTKNVLPERIKRRSEMQLLHDRHVLSQIALRNPGANSSELALLFNAMTGISIKPRTVRDDLAAIRKKWVSETNEDFRLLRAREINRLNVLEQEAWDAWNQSKSDFVKKVIERARKPPARQPDAGDMIAKIVAALAQDNNYVNEEVVETIVHDAVKEMLEDSVESGEDGDTFISKIVDTTEARVGDVKFLRAIHEIQQERRKILGVYAPELHQVNVRKIELKGYARWSPDNWNNDDIVDGEAVPVEQLEGGD